VTAQTEISLVVNGTRRVVPGETTLADLVAACTDRSEGVAIAVNSAVVSRKQWARTRLVAGDKVEILGAHQGG